MSWIQKLCDTYDENESIAGKYLNEKEEPLLPIGHLFVNCQLEITIDGNGEFVKASFVDEEDRLTITPCTEESASKSGKKAKVLAHLLSDKLYYFSGDNEKYGIQKSESYQAYLNNLEKWVKSEQTHPLIEALHKYINKGHLLSDLVNYGICSVDAKGNLESKWDKEKYPKAPKTTKQFEAFVRWRVEMPDYLEDRLWRNSELHTLWSAYYMKEKTEVAFCQVYGEEKKIARLHPKNINANAANAKIISSNDKNGYTFRGRFLQPEQAYQISYEASQKMHNALRWLIAKQGFKYDKRAIVVWGEKNKEILSVWDDGYGLFDDCEKEEVIYTAEDSAHFFTNRLRGYSSNNTKKNVMDKVFIMSIEAVTDGRMSITYFREYNEQEYIDHILNWHKSCCWLHTYKTVYEDGKSRRVKFIGAPSPKDIINALYAKPKDKDGNGIKVNEKLYLATLDRILMCILEGRKMPLDMIQTMMTQVCNRIRYHKQVDFEKALSIACALFNKYTIDYMKEEYKMALETERKSRDYLYGRLLAIAQNIESWAISEANGENRMTNADRLMQRFAQHPFTTWKTIELGLKPYLSKLKERGFYRERLMDEIMNLFNPEDFINDKPLTGEFLIGYHCQRQSLYNYKKSNKEEQGC